MAAVQPMVVYTVASYQTEKGEVGMKKILSLFLAVLLLCCSIPCALAADGEKTAAADTLYALGLFQGKGRDENGKPIYALDDRPTRSEAVTMLVRLLGKEGEANTGAWNLPFTDVDDWAIPYVGYAYAHGLTKGVGETTFGGTSPITATQYLTFVLRALGYDSGTEFKWDAAWELSDAIGLTHGEYGAASGDFLRGDIAGISCSALEQPLAHTSKTLLESLIDAGAVNSFAADAVGFAVELPENGTEIRIPCSRNDADNKCSVETAELLRAFPTAVTFVNALYSEFYGKALGMPETERALYEAVYTLQTNPAYQDRFLDRSKAEFEFMTQEGICYYLFDGNGDAVAYYRGSAEGNSKDALTFVVYRVKCAQIWAEITETVDRAVVQCLQNEVWVDLNTVTKTESDGSTRHPIYLNGTPLSNLPEPYIFQGFYSSAKWILTSEAKFQAEIRRMVFRTIWSPVLIDHGSGPVPYDVKATDILLQSPDSELVMFLLDQNRDFVGCFLVNMQTDYTIR